MIALEKLVKVIDAQPYGAHMDKRLRGVSLDSRTLKKDDIFFAIKGTRFDGHDFLMQAIKKGAGALVVEKHYDAALLVRGKKNNCVILKVAHTKTALACLARFQRMSFEIPCIAITGSSGKTTTKELTASVLASRYRVLKNQGTYNNDIGVPLTLFGLNQKHEIAVVELGTNHFGEIARLSSLVCPQVGVITNIAGTHLEFLKNTQGVLKEKISMAQYLHGPKILLLNRDDALLQKVKIPRSLRVLYFSTKEKSDIMASRIVSSRKGLTFVLNKKHTFHLNTVGSFNIYNALAALSCGLVFGLSIRHMKNVLKHFIFPSHRLNRICCSHFSIIDDTYNSNPFSLRHAVESLVSCSNRGRRIVIMGDMLELGSRAHALHKQAGNFIAQKPIDMFITLGALSKMSARVAQSCNRDKRTIVSFDSKSDLVSFVKDHIQTGDTVLIKGSRFLKMEDIATSLKNYAL